MTGSFRSADIAQGVARMHGSIAPVRDDLNAADRLLGDGDTGMTIAQVVAAWSEAAADLPPDVGSALVALGKQTRRASGSSLGAVLAIGLTAAGKSAVGKDTLDRRELAALLAAAAAAISERSGAAPGDKTVLDSLLRIERELRAAPDAAPLLDAVVTAAAAALDDFRQCQARVGRARIYGEKSIGHDDPGMLAVLLLLRAARDAA